MIPYITESTGNQINPILIPTTELIAMWYKLRSKIRFPPAKQIRMRSNVRAWKTKKERTKERVMTEAERYNERVDLQITDGIVISIGKVVQSAPRLRRGIQKASGVGSAGEGGRDGPRFSPPPYRQSHYDTQNGGKIVTQNVDFTNTRLYISLRYKDGAVGLHH
jgi:hypothetical protein